MMITKNTFYAAVTVAMALSLSACSHNPPKAEVASKSGPVVLTPAEKSFVDRSIATDPIESLLVAEVAHLLMGTPDEAVFLAEAGRFLSTDERLTAENVARHFTEEQGLAFLKDEKIRNVEMFKGSLSEISGRIDHEIAKSARSGNLNARSNISSGMALTDATDLVKAVRHAGLISPKVRNSVTRIYTLTRYPAVDEGTCVVMAKVRPSSKANIETLYDEVANVAQRIPSCVKNPVAWMKFNAAVAEFKTARDVFKAAEPLDAEENLIAHCHLLPGIGPEAHALNEEYKKTGKVPEYDYSCENY